MLKLFKSLSCVLLQASETVKPNNKPAHSRPIILQPATDACTTGIWSDKAPSNTLQQHMHKVYQNYALNFKTSTNTSHQDN